MYSQKDIDELTEAIRLTVEYAGTELLRPYKGWSWYEALKKYAPEKADRLRDEYRSRHSE